MKASASRTPTVPAASLNKNTAVVEDIAVDMSGLTPGLSQFNAGVISMTTPPVVVDSPVSLSSKHVVPNIPPPSQFSSSSSVSEQEASGDNFGWDDDEVEVLQELQPASFHADEHGKEEEEDEEPIATPTPVTTPNKHKAKSPFKELSDEPAEVFHEPKSNYLADVLQQVGAARALLPVFADDELEESSSSPSSSIGGVVEMKSKAKVIDVDAEDRKSRVAKLRETSEALRQTHQDMGVNVKDVVGKKKKKNLGSRTVNESEVNKGRVAALVRKRKGVKAQDSPEVVNLVTQYSDDDDQEDNPANLKNNTSDAKANKTVIESVHSDLDEDEDDDLEDIPSLSSSSVDSKKDEPSFSNRVPSPRKRIGFRMDTQVLPCSKCGQSGHQVTGCPDAVRQQAGDEDGNADSDGAEQHLLEDEALLGEDDELEVQRGDSDGEEQPVVEEDLSQLLGLEGSAPSTRRRRKRLEGTLKGVEHRSASKQFASLIATTKRRSSSRYREKKVEEEPEEEQPSPEPKRKRKGSKRKVNARSAQPSSRYTGASRKKPGAIKEVEEQEAAGQLLEQRLFSEEAEEAGEPVDSRPSKKRSFTPVIKPVSKVPPKRGRKTARSLSSKKKPKTETRRKKAKVSADTAEWETGADGKKYLNVGGRLFAGIRVILTGMSEEQVPSGFSGRFENIGEWARDALISNGAIEISNLESSPTIASGSKLIHHDMFPNTLLVSNAPHRTLKFIQSLASSTPCVHWQWISDCVSDGVLYSLHSYYLDVADALICSVPLSWADWNAQRPEGYCPLFQGLRVDLNGLDGWKSVVDELGGVVRQGRLHSCSGQLDLALSTVDQHQPNSFIVANANKMAVPLRTPAWVVSCLVNHRFIQEEDDDFDADMFVADEPILSVDSDEAMDRDEN